MFQKWLTIVSIPLVFEVVFVTVFVFLLNQADLEVAEQLRSQSMKASVQNVIVSADEALFVMADYGVSRDARVLEEITGLKNGIDASLNKLKSLCDKSDERQLRSAQKLIENWGDYSRAMTQVSQWVHSDKINDVNEQLLAMTVLREKLLEGNAAIKELFTYQSELDEVTKQRHEFTDMCLRLWLAIGVTANLLIAVMLTRYFSKDVTERISALKENSLRLAIGKELLPSVKGKDEIAEFDETFYELATELQIAFDREKANFDNAADAICALDSGGRITRFNQAFEATLKYSSGEILQSNFIDYIDPSDRPKWSETRETSERNGFDKSRESRGASARSSGLNGFLDTVREGNAKCEAEMRMISKTGRSREFLWSFAWEPKQELFLCVGHDITEYKQLEHAKQEFVAMLSHDLRSPLTAIGATFELVLNGAFGPVNEKLDTTLTRARQSVKRLVSLISELLDLEKLEAGELDLKIARVHSNEVISAAIDAVKPAAESHRIDIQISEQDVLMYADSDRIIRVVINFLSNAIKYSPDGGKILIEAEKTVDGYVISVADRGNGIPEEHLGRIFERYKQVSRTDHTVKQGSGLGLAICKSIVEAHGGTIGVKSKVGEGTTFWFCLPEPSG